MSYAELHCISNYSFLRGASRPEELVARAHALGYAALAITDECSLAGVVRAHEQARETGLKLIIGTELRLHDGPHLLLLATSRKGYTQLCRLITRGRRKAAKGAYELRRKDLEDGLADCLALFIPPRNLQLDEEQLQWFKQAFAETGWLAVTLLRDGVDEPRLQQLQAVGTRYALPLVAAGNVCMHAPGRRPLRDLLSAIRHHCTLDRLGGRALPNAERHLRSLDDLRLLYPAQLLRQSLEIAQRCKFSLDELRYEYPDDVTPPGMQPQDYLRQLVEQGKRERWPQGCPRKVRLQIEQELQLIAQLDYAAYFLTVWDIVAFARKQGILCQGRGSAANSAVCYCLGITEVDPARMNLLFERFISRERGEPPDIDVDFEHERREEVIQYIYRKYGRERAALAATVITYRPKSALRDAGKALGFSLQQVEQLAQAVSGWRSWGDVQGAWLEEAGFDLENPRIRQLLRLGNELLGFPRHLSQHVGGFVISRGGLDELAPVENAAMPGRTIIQWDKDDLESLGLLKVDVLALGMLSAIRRALRLLDPAGRMRLQDIPAEDPEVYAMIGRADTLGVFQIESRAQMSMLPRLKPENFYDLVVEVAIVRPGPIQGDMVHPYLRRRQGREPVEYPSEDVRAVLERTLGVPIFQEQVIKLTQVAAGFSPGEADQIRRSMAAWKRRGGMEIWEQKLKSGMRQRGYSEAYAECIFRQIQGFGEYGFPESHAASFALLVYVSAWIKCHHPAVFAAALLNSQPMGFYAPAQLVGDARAHGVKVLPAEVNASDWDCTLETREGMLMLRLGLRMIKGLSRQAVQRLVLARQSGAFESVQQLAARADLKRRDLNALAAADALHSLEQNRRMANWSVAAIEARLPLLADAPPRERQPGLPLPAVAEEVLADYAHLGLSLRCHPLALLREKLEALRFVPAEAVGRRQPGLMVRAAGLVLTRQRPGKGNAVFITLEDETGSLNLIIWRHLAERQRKIVLGAKLLGVWAEIQRADGVQHLIVRRLYDHSSLLAELRIRSRDFH
ncbi:error-prone DNA polymerase [Thiolapillus sp.]